MSRTLASLALAAALAAPAAAVGFGFSADYTGSPVPTIGAINVSVNPELVRETSAVENRSYQNYIAPRDAEELAAELREELEEELSRAGAYAPGQGGTLNVVIENATPSNPAHTQNGRNRGLDFRSAGRGGATVVAELVAADGTSVADFTYRWEESTFDVSSTPRIAWYGAERAFDRFADRLARELAD